MKIYAIRHGQSETNAINHFGGWIQVPLTPLGFQQAELAGKRIANIPFDRVYSSDLLRARQTAATALPEWEAIQDPRIREVSVGELMGRSVEEATSQYGSFLTNHRRVYDFTPFGGEDMNLLGQRVSSFMEEIKLLPVSNVAVFTHAGAMYAMLCHVLGIEPNKVHLTASNCAVSVFSWENGVWRLEKWNVTDEL